MDLAEQTRTFLADPVSLLAPACSARRDGFPADAAELAVLLRGAAVEDLAVKRNLVFLQWRTASTRGAAILAWDQDGFVTTLDVYA